MKFEEEIIDGVYLHPNVVFSVWVYTVVGFVFLFVGFILAHIVYGKQIKIKQNQVLSSHYPVSINRYDTSNSNFKWVLSLLLLSVAVLLFYRQQIGEFPLESIFRGLSGADLALLRSDATNNFSGKYYRYAIFMEILPLFLFILVAIIRNPQMSRKWNVLFVLLIIYNIFYSIISLQKAPLVNFLILCYLIYSYRKRKMEKKPLLIVGSIVVVLVILMYVFFMGRAESPVSDILGGALHRIFISSIIPFFWYIMYTNKYGLLYGTSFPNPGGIFPFEHFRLPVEVMNYARRYDSDVVGTMPTIFIGEMYSNFGIVGIIVSAVLVGFILQAIDILFWKRMNNSKGVLLSTIFIYLIIHCYHYTISGVSGVLFDTNLYTILFLALWYYKRTRNFDKKHLLKQYE